MSNVFGTLGVSTSGMGVYKTWLNAVADNVALARLFDRVVIMKEGRVIEQGEVAELDRDGLRVPTRTLDGPTGAR